MAFSSAITDRTVMGNKRVNFGTMLQANGDTGGAIVTGLQMVDFFQCTFAKNIAVSGGTATVTTTDPGGAQAGFWMAVGV